LHWYKGYNYKYLPQAVQEVIRGEVPVQFDVEMGEIWDMEEITQERNGDWPEELEDYFPSSILRPEGPSGGQDTKCLHRASRLG
jgi:hypothetical protein